MSMNPDDFIHCEHLPGKNEKGELSLGDVYVVIDIGTKQLALCRMCDNTLRGHYIDEVTHITVKVKS